MNQKYKAESQPLFFKLFYAKFMDANRVTTNYRHKTKPDVKKRPRANHGLKLFEEIPELGRIAAHLK